MNEADAPQVEPWRDTSGEPDVAAAVAVLGTRSRPFKYLLGGTILVGTALAMAFLAVAVTQNGRDGLAERMRSDIQLLAAPFHSGAMPFTEDNLADVVGCAGDDCRRIEYRNVALVGTDGTVVTALDLDLDVPPAPATALPEGFESGTAGADLPITISRDGGITTAHVLIGQSDAGSPFFLALQRTSTPAPSGVLFAIVGLVTATGILLILLPAVARRDDLLVQQEAAVAGLIKGKADALRHANAVEKTKSDFLTAVSHRFRSPLQIIQGTAKLLGDPNRQLTPEMAHELATRLQSNSKKLDELLRDLLDVDRLVRGTMEPARTDIDVTDVVQRVATGLDLGDRLRLPAEAVHGNADIGHLERIIEHLLRNAVQFSPAQAPIEVTAERTAEAFEVKVLDRGPGIPQEHRLRVFDPLYRIEDGRADPGVGVGLALVQRLAAAHGGRAWAEPREGGGTAIHLRIPDVGSDRGIDLWQLSGNMAT